MWDQWGHECWDLTLSPFCRMNMWNLSFACAVQNLHPRGWSCVQNYYQPLPHPPPLSWRGVVGLNIDTCRWYYYPLVVSDEIVVSTAKTLYLNPFTCVHDIYVCTCHAWVAPVISIVLMTWVAPVISIVLITWVAPVISIVLMIWVTVTEIKMKWAKPILSNSDNQMSF